MPHDATNMLDRIKKRKAWVVVALVGAAAAAGGTIVTDLGQPDLTELEQITNIIIESQEQYFEVYGRYWQGFITDETLPKDGLRITPTNLDSKPSDQNESWNDLVTFTETLPVQIRVDTYSRADDHGYQIVYKKEELNRILERSIGFGDDRDKRTWGWIVIGNISTAAATTTP